MSPEVEVEGVLTQAEIDDLLAVVNDYNTHKLH